MLAYAERNGDFVTNYLGFVNIPELVAGNDRVADLGGGHEFPFLFVIEVVYGNAAGYTP